MELTIPDKKYVCVDYPGIVINSEKALETLGGLKSVFKTFNDRTTRMKLNFRNEDSFSKPTYGDCFSRISLIIKVRRKKNNTNGGIEAANELEGEIIGTSDTVYNFSSMCDFQYTPMKLQEDGSYKSHADENHIEQVQPKEWLTRPAHLFVLPPLFSRFDQPVQYCFRNTSNFKNFQFPDNCIGISRSRRAHFTMFFKFCSPSVPEAAHEESLKKIERIYLPSWKVDKVKEKFECQKIWSTVALYAEVGPSITREDLKHILPSVAYYCIDGPWRAMWVKLGYDMRTDPSSKIYQNLDSRQEKKMSSLCSNKIPAKRSTFNYHLPNSVARGLGQQSCSIQNSENEEFDETAFKKSLECSYFFRPGVAPKHRQIFYHLCNIDEPKVQKLVHANDGKETECTEKDGWCLPDTIDKCRSIINSYRNKRTGNFGSAPQVLEDVITEENGERQDEKDSPDKDSKTDGNRYEDEYGYEYDEEEEEEDACDGTEELYEANESSVQSIIDQENLDKILDLLPTD